MHKSAMDVVNAARDQSHISDNEILENLFDDYFELHGDQAGADDPAIIGGLATFHDQPVTVITTSRGKDMNERMKKHFGQPEPAGYRKACRLVENAAKFNRPVIFFVDTAGAYPGKSAEENGQGHAISQNLLKIGSAAVPIITVMYGEGGSGGALALACGDRVLMLENSIYSVLSPEGFASILYKDAQKAPQAAEDMKLTPQDLLDQKVIEKIIPEANDHKAVFKELDQVLVEELNTLRKLSKTELLNARYERFRKF